jgi:hypothetical protein
MELTIFKKTNRVVINIQIKRETTQIGAMVATCKEAGARSHTISIQAKAIQDIVFNPRTTSFNKIPQGLKVTRNLYSKTFRRVVTILMHVETSRTLSQKHISCMTN